MRNSIKIAMVVTGFAVFGLTILDKNTPEAVAAENSRKDISSAETMCQLAFEARAKDPSSVDWLRKDRQFSYTSADKTSAISKQPVRAKNGFGALDLTIAECVLTKTAGAWQVTKLKEI